MNDLDEQTIHRNRFEFFINLLEKEFPKGKIDPEYDSLWTLIKVSQKKAVPLPQRRPNVVFDLDENFMTDEDSEYERIMNDGIQTAKQILEHPPFEDKNNQGTIHLNHKGVIFKKPS